jgi:hypothetical protein
MTVPKCPKCSLPMRLQRITSEREWACIHCSGILVQIPSQTTLPSSVIAEDLARRSLLNSAELKNAKTQYKRLSSGIRKATNDRYLSNREREALTAAVDVIERLAGAAATAAGIKRTIEQEEEQRKRIRWEEASAGARRIFDRKDLREQACTILAISRVNNRNGLLSSGWIGRIQRRNPPSLLQAVSIKLLESYNEAIHDLADNIAWRKEPVEDLLQKASLTIANAMEAVGQAEPVIELDRMLIIENAENVQRLPKRSG